MVNISGKALAGIGIVGFLILAIFFGGIIYFVTSSDDDGEPWNPDTAGYSGLEHDVVNDEDVAESTEEFIADTDEKTETETETETLDVADNADTTDGETTSTPEADTDDREAPLMRTPTLFKVQSALPTSQAYWAYELKTEYPVLEGAKIAVYQDIPNLAITNYKTTGTTKDSGYTDALDLESNSFSEWKGVDGKAYVLLESEHVASTSGKLGYTISVPETRNSVKVLKVVPDTYAFSTILTSEGDSIFSINNADNVNIESMKPCAKTSSWGWDMGSIQTFDVNEFDVYLSTSSTGNWKQLTSTTMDATANSGDGEIHILVAPMILDEKTIDGKTVNEYDGTPLDLSKTGEKTFYIKFTSGVTSQKYKVTYTVTPTSVSTPTFTKI